MAELRRRPGEPARRGAAHDLARHRREAATRSTTRSRRSSCARAAGTSSRSTPRSTASPVSASLFDFGLFVFHCARPLLDSGLGPYLYLPKLESHHEARLWHDVFTLAEEKLGLDRGSIRATVLIETILAAFEMDEILHALGEHAAGLNAGRWDYIFSVIKKLGHREEFLLPDRGDVTMAVPFMRAYADLLVHTCHRRGAYAIGGMAAFIPSRRDAEVNEAALAKVREDKQREAGQGFDGTWVAHPGSRPDRAAGVRAREPARRRARRRAARRGGAARRRVDAGLGHRGRPAPERRRRHPLHRVVAERRRRGRDLQPDGGRRDVGDLALAGVAVAASRPREPRRGARDDRRARWRSCATCRGPTRRASCSSPSRSTTTSSSS